MELILLGFCIILLCLYGSKAVMMHRNYNNQLYAVLFSSYLEYFYRNVIRHDCSSSSLLTENIGIHKLSFTTIQSRIDQVTSHYVLIFYNKGIACIRYLNPNGSLIGNMSEKYWIIQQDGKKFKLVNPMIECKQYSNRIKKLCPDVNVQEYIACPDECDIHKVTSSIYHYRDIVETLKSISLPYISDENILTNYENVSSKNGQI